MRLALFLGAAVLAVSMATGGAQAAQVSCPASFTANGTAKVNVAGSSTNTAASACQYISPASSSTVANETNVNNAAFFGFSDWDILAAFNQVDPSNDNSGSATIAGGNLSTFDYMIVFKDGAGTNLTGFLLTALSFDWLTPFTDPPFDLPGGSTVHGVSHLSIFQRPDGGTPSVPEPMTLALLGAGLLGLGAAARRRRHS